MRHLDQIRIAYLLSQYPTAGHSYLLREVLGLRKLGLKLEVASISGPDRERSSLRDEEEAEFDRTFYVKWQGIPRIAAAQLRCLVSRPLKYLGGVWMAISLSGGGLRKTLRHLFYFLEGVVVGEWMKRNGVQHCHTHFSSTVALFLKRVYGYTISMTLHGHGELSDPFSFHLEKKMAEAEFVITISKYGKSQLMLYSPTRSAARIEAIYLGIDSDRFRPVNRADSPRQFEIITVGRVTKVKGYTVLLDALEKLIRDGRNVRLRIVGDGDERPALEAKIEAMNLSDHVIWEGVRNEDGVRELLGKADIFALASFSEGVPVVLMEAMSTGLPCVATRITGIPELIRDGIDGLLVTPSDDDELAGAIANLIEDSVLRSRIGLAGRMRIEDKFNLDRNVSALADVYLQLLPEGAFQPASAQPLRVAEAISALRSQNAD